MITQPIKKDAPVPESMNNNQLQLATTTPELSYFEKRMALLGIKPEFNCIDLWQATKFGEDGNGENVLKPLPVFRESPKGIDILVYNLDRNIIRTKTELQRSGIAIKADDKLYCITRLEHPIIKANGDTIKYLKPAKEPSYPFFPPRLVKKFDQQKQVKTLYVTEGFFKAFKADMHGIDCIGLQSITCLRDKDTNTLWADITRLVIACKVERLVWLTDGDFMNITAKDLTEGIDLYKRPNVFYSSAHTFYELTSGLDCEKYFAHINSDTLPGNPKGLDDLLCANADNTAELATEFNNFSIMAPGKVYPGQFITRINITLGTGRVREYILHEDVTKFYLYHREHRPELKDITTFKYNGTTYRYDEKEGKCVIEVPGEASKYERVGNDFYEHIEIPNKKGEPVKTLTGRTKGTIIDDHGKNFIKHIKKYSAFCIIPDHFNYQPIASNCYNLYNPFTWEQEEGDFSNTLAFIKHIFGEELVSCTENGITTQIPRYELALDYLTIAYKYPWQMLPILCLVSRERQTGKTTFINYIDALFSGNAISIGNEDIEADFNAHWAGKLFIMVDETKVDNGKVINKIKRLSTAGDIILNAKGKDQVKLPFFAKFILNSNHVEDFIRIDKEEIRFWINNVKPMTGNINPNFLDELKAEIPAFLHYLNNRQIISKNKERHWFDSQLLYTDALRIVKENSITTMEKRIRTEIADLFEMCDRETLEITLEALCTEILKKADKTYVKKILHDMGLKTKSGRGKFPRRVEGKGGDLNQVAGISTSLEWIGFNTTYYTFERSDFTDRQPLASIDNTGNDVKLIDDLPF